MIAAFVSPFRADRETTRALFGEDEFLEVHVDLPAELAAERDTTGLYAKAQAGELANLTGVGDAYEPPEEPELHLDMTSLSTSRKPPRRCSRPSPSAACSHDLAVHAHRPRPGPDRRASRASAAAR